VLSSRLNCVSRRIACGARSRRTRRRDAA
jgi:hypothetical protein